LTWFWFLGYYHKKAYLIPTQLTFALNLWVAVGDLEAVNTDNKLVNSIWESWSGVVALWLSTCPAVQEKYFQKGRKEGREGGKERRRVISDRDKQHEDNESRKC
jgi:hypothetical protein